MWSTRCNINKPMGVSWFITDIPLSVQSQLPTVQDESELTALIIDREKPNERLQNHCRVEELYRSRPIHPEWKVAESYQSEAIWTRS
jgi:hypothetical protein